MVVAYFFGPPCKLGVACTSQDNKLQSFPAYPAMLQ